MRIAEFENMKIEVTWTLLSICFNSNSVLKNCEHDQSFISGYEIMNYAGNLLNTTDNSRIISLAILNENEKEEIAILLQQLSEEENLNYDTEFRKFRAMYISLNLPGSNDDFMHGILKISEIWAQFNFPEDSPNIYFDFKDYSLENFKILLRINKRWLQKEFEDIRT